MMNNKLNDKILKDFKKQVSISNFRKDLDMEKQKTIKYSFNKVAAILVLTILLTGATFATTQIIGRFENIDIIYSIGSVKEAIENGYAENIDMDYAYSKDDIGVKITSLMISDNDFYVTLDFDFKKANVPESIFVFGYLIYDENYNLYYYEEPKLSNSNKRLKQFYKENKVTNYDKNDLLGNMYGNTGAVSPITITNEKVITQVSFNSKKQIPKSNKIYVKIFSLGTLDDSDFKPIAKSEWKLEVDVPEKFHNRYSIEYELKESVQDFELVSTYVSETSMTVIAKTSDLNGLLNKIKIVDENGKEFTEETSSNLIDENTFITKYSLNKDKIPNRLYIKTNIYGKETTTELIKK